jgi:hypothetical protein
MEELGFRTGEKEAVGLPLAWLSWNGLPGIFRRLQGAEGGCVGEGYADDLWRNERRRFANTPLSHETAKMGQLHLCCVDGYRCVTGVQSWWKSRGRW